ncbi:hypothetical protein ABZ297_42425 [Nonomuraea sp. NPDC005983]|uniref:hypothetical protein n=1 Tax=Nonomuraea sp. NPDC005983 TaxID=3155595 RepID=UPI0033B95E6C
MTTRTEQETRRGTPVRGDVPKTGQRRPGVPHQSKPIPRPRPSTEGPKPGTARPAAARPAPAAVRRRPVVRRRQRAPFVLLVVGLLCGGLVSLLLLNTVLAQDSITAKNLRDEIAQARQQNEATWQQNQIDTQPGVIATKAGNQGLHRDDTINVISSGENNQADQGR